MTRYSFDDEPLSNCCGYPSLTEVIAGQGICGNPECRDHATFEEEEEIDESPTPMPDHDLDNKEKKLRGWPGGNI